MLRERKRLIHKLALAADGAVVALSFALAFCIRDRIEFPLLHDLAPFTHYLWVMALIVPLWLVMLESSGVYQSMRQKSFSSVFWSVCEASIGAIIAFAVVAFFMKFDYLSRTFVIVFLFTAITLLTAEKAGSLLILRHYRRKGYNFRSLVIVGSGPRAEQFARVVEAHAGWGLTILGFVDDPERLGMRVGSGKVIGSFDDLPMILDRNVVDEVVFLLPRKWLDRLETYVRICEKVGVRATIAVDFFDTAIARPVVQDLHGWPLLTFDATPHDFLRLTVKRVFDFVAAGLGLIVLSPLFIALAIAIKATSKGPVFFRQSRCGLNGRTFMILKFRTMTADAEERLAGLRERNELSGPVFKIRNDPRVTPVGRFLRRTSLDELPQLINVLRGEMSLVGPRPPLPHEVERYERWQRRRLSMRPGITCIHEVVARNDKDFTRWMKLDLEYIDNWALSLDMRILARTIVAVLRGTGC
jgi:exopolysaccharide biosynthesis polyprenyl glycosylphosphotransferase